MIGAGVAGLTAAHLLRRRYDVTLFEADDRLGGHAHTHEVPASDGGVAGGRLRRSSCTTTRTYPTLLRLFAELGVATQDSEMSMSVRCEGCGLEYAGARRLGGLFPQWSNLARPAYLRMLGEVLRFHRHARRRARATTDGAEDVTLGEFLAIGGYSRYFTDHFVLPLVACVWSAGEAVSAAYPARYLFTFLDHHGLLSVGRLAAVAHRRRRLARYVERVAKGLGAVAVSTPVRAVVRRGGRTACEIRDDADTVHRADRVVIATHADDALALLADPTPAETGRARRVRLLAATRPSCTPTPRCCRGGRGRGPRGTT